MATADVQDLKDISGRESQNERHRSTRIGKRTEEEIRDEHQTLRLLRQIKRTQSEILQAVSKEHSTNRKISGDGDECANSLQSITRFDSIIQETSVLERQLGEQLSLKEQKITELDERVSEKVGTIKVLEEEVTQLTEENVKLSENDQTNTSKIDELEQKVTEKKDKIKMIQRENSILIESIEENKGAVTTLKQQLEYRTNMEQLQWQLTQITLKDELNSTLQQRCDELTEEMKDLEAEKEDVYRELYAQKDARSSLSEDMQEKINECKVLKKITAERETRSFDLIAEIGKEKHKNEELSTKLQNETAERENNGRELEKMKNENAKLQDELMITKRRMLSSTSSNDLVKKQEELTSVKEENEKIRKALKQEEDEKEKKIVELDEASFEITKLQDKLAKAEDALSMEAAASNSSSDLVRKQEELTSVKEENENIRTALKQEEDEKEKKIVELDGASVEIAKLKDKLARAEDALSMEAAASNSNSELVRKQEEDLTSVKKEIEKIRKALKREEDEKEKKIVELDEASFEIAKLQDKLARAEYALSSGAAASTRSYDTPVNINIKADGEKTCDVQGIVCTGPGVFVLTDWDNKTVKTVDISRNSVISVLQLDASPFDITHLKPELLAVTLPKVEQVAFVKLHSSGNLALLELIRINKECFGITTLDSDHIIVVNSNVEVYDLRGNRTDILVDMTNDRMKSQFEDLQYVAFGNNLLYLTDWERNSVTCLSMDKEIQSQFHFTEEILQEHSAPLGLAVSSTGTVFLRCRKGVYKLDMDLQNGRSLAPRLPRGVCLAYCEWDRKVFVAFTKSNAVIGMAISHV